MLTKRRNVHLSFAAAVAKGFHFAPDAPLTPPAPAPTDNVKTLREEFSRLQGEGSAVIELAKKENRDLKPDEKTANDARFSRMQTIKSVLDEGQRFAMTLSPGGEGGAAGTTVQGPTNPPGREEFAAALEGTTVKIDRAKFSKALTGWAETGHIDRQFATITTATASGALLPKEIAEPEVPTSANVFREALALYNLQPVKTGTTAALTVPVMGTAAGGVVAEDASAETENAPTLSGSIVLNVSTYQSGTGWFSNQQLAAVDFDLVSYVQTDMNYAKELGLESAAVAAMIADAAITQNVTLALTTGFTYGELVDLNRKLPKRYDRQKVIILNASAYSAAEKMVDTTGQPILMRDPQNQELLRFNGTPVLRSDYLEAFGANKIVGMVVSMIGFKLRDAGQQQLARYTQSPGKPNQTGFNLFAYHAYGYTVAAVAKLKCAAA